MSAVWASYKITVNDKNNCEDAGMAQKIFDYCKEHYDWFLEWGEGPFGIEDNVISTAPAFEDADGFDMKYAGDLLDDPIGWLQEACEECKPEQLKVSVSVDASETGSQYPYRKIVATLEDGELRIDTDLQYNEFPDMESGIFDDCEELEDFQPCFAPDSFCDFLAAKNYETSDVGEVRLVFKTDDGEETEPIRINPNDCSDVSEALECEDFHLEQGYDTSLRDVVGESACKLADIDIEKVIENGRENFGDSAEFLGLSLPGLKAPVMLKVWKK